MRRLVAVDGVHLQRAQCDVRPLRTARPWATYRSQVAAANRLTLKSTVRIESLGLNVASAAYPPAVSEMALFAPAWK